MGRPRGGGGGRSIPRRLRHWLLRLRSHRNFPSLTHQLRVSRNASYLCVNSETRGGGISISASSLFEPATTLLPGQDNKAPSGPMSRPSCFLISCGVRLSEVGLLEIRKPQVARSIRVAGSTFHSLVLLVQFTRVSGCGGGAGSSASFQSSRRLTKCRYSPPYKSPYTSIVA